MGGDGSLRFFLGEMGVAAGGADLVRRWLGLSVDEKIVSFIFLKYILMIFWSLYI